ncbi:MAG: beta-glucosidase [Treponema sp. GWB1_62_6]|nr:MAG: beta-glucosidase [Treponema sp. GWA1_62_8]OHE70300.1 MAG: beta-glucosidase [Treponema sp. GWC1_61_84]OHE71167.1 MAG: beta-glucosidase [Treponema sp. GWB1_62_6]HCM26682.1 beta-glucosidase [Treponema sp.]
MSTEPYPSSAEKVEMLLGRMTVEEKIGQLMQLDGRGRYIELIRDYHVGSLLHINGSDADAALKASMSGRLGIPVLLADDGIHGHSFWAGAAIFPTQLAMACSWDTELLEEAARVTAVEMRATGLKWTFSPVLCLARDLRWGRIGETFGEDPLLIGELAVAMIRGYQGRGLSDPDAVLATAKHYAGYSETLGGRDASEAELSTRKLRSSFLPPFERAAKAGAMTFMTGYQSIDGVPSTASRWLLTTVLKEEWGFKGILVTDWNNVGHLVDNQRICADYAEAAAVALKAGNDLIMATPEFFDGCREALERGLLSVAELDAVVRRVLNLKFRMGLFENPGFSDPERIRTRVGCVAHRQVALRAARESLVLLRNERKDGMALLPFDPSRPRKLALVGPNADSPLAQLGDWSLGSGQMTGPSGSEHPRSATVTVLDGIRRLLPSGWTLVEPETADLIVAVVGDRLDYIGETKSTATLELQDGQIELLQSLAALGKPLVGILINSKPLVLPRVLMEAPALLEAFNPGMEGGTAIAEALFGLLNPSGKLPISFPRHVGQQPVFYNAVRGQHGAGYADLPQDPAFSFGFGLGYSEFSTGEPRLDRDAIRRDEAVSVEAEVLNLGGREGVEVVQLYVEDEVTSATWARRELKAWKRVKLQAGEAARVRFELKAEDLWIIDAAGNKVVEPGRFRILVGSSSRDRDLKEARLTVI